MWDAFASDDLRSKIARVKPSNPEVESNRLGDCHQMDCGGLNQQKNP